jgi:hypothetical protein
VAAPLGLGELLLDVAVKVPRLEFRAIAGRRRIFEPQIQTHGFLGSD